MRLYLAISLPVIQLQQYERNIGKVEDQLTKGVAQQLAREYVELIERTGITRILNDVRGIRSQMNIIEDYNYAYSDVHEIGLPRGIRAAILADEGDTSHDFQQTVASNAGYIVRVFYSYKDAVNWLTEDRC